MASEVLLSASFPFLFRCLYNISSHVWVSEFLMQKTAGSGAARDATGDLRNYPCL